MHPKTFSIEEVKHYMVQDKGLFNGEFEWSYNNVEWSRDALQINSIGQLTIYYPQLSHHPAVVESGVLKLNNSNIFNLHERGNSGETPLDTGNPLRDVIMKNLHSSSVSFLNQSGIPLVQVVSVNKEKCYFRSVKNEKTQFVRFVASLMVWQNMNIYGIHNKYFSIPLPYSGGHGPSTALQSIQLSDEDNEDNVIIINKEEKNLLVCRFKVFGPIPKTQRRTLETCGPRVPLYPQGGKDVHEGWFFSMGVLKSNGILDLLLEYDGTLLYSINVSCLIRSEIRQVHHSIFENSNVLFIGVINELREANINVNTCPSLQKPTFFLLSPVTRFTELKNATLQRILIDFPLHIDLEDWFVALKSLAAREYVGINLQYSAKSSFRISKQLHVDVLEASFDDAVCSDNENEYGEGAAKLYTDIILWGSTWARTCIVESAKSPFWREEFDFDLPILTNTFQIVVKKCVLPNKKTLFSGERHPDKTGYSDKDVVLGSVNITEETIENSNNKEVWIPIYLEDTAEQIGQVCLRLSLKEWHVLPPSNFDVLQKMLLNTSLADMILFLGTLTARYEDLEEVATMMLDIFQALHREELWFGELIDYELERMETMLREKPSTGLLSNFFNTLFRGNSILTKTFEKYNLRVGQEFLQKVVGEFVLQVAEDNYECEIDPARINVSSKEEKEYVLDDNFMRLFDYVESIWTKIYNSCNDLPAPIRKELEIFRNKLEAACDPADPKSGALALNCVTGFLFLRLICPAILNPKLFFLIKDHQTGNIKRTLTLVSKILLTLSNRTRFGAKESWLIKMNYFLELHEHEMLHYLDIVTNRKSDPRSKILDLSDTVVRPDISISPQISVELPTNPFLIDKYLRLTQLANILAAELINQQDEFNFESVAGTARLSSVSQKAHSFRNSYKIGSLVFEEQVVKNNNLAFASEELLRNLSLLNSTNRISTNLAKHSRVSLADVKQESYLILKKINGLDHLLTSFENPSLIYANWGKFVNTVVESSIVDHRKRLLYSSSLSDNPNFRKLNDDGIAFLKLKFNTKAPPLDSSTDHSQKAHDSFASTSIGSSLMNGPPKLSRLIKSSSSHTLGMASPNRTSFDESINNPTNDGSKSPFKKTFFWRKKN